MPNAYYPGAADRPHVVVKQFQDGYALAAGFEEGAVDVFEGDDDDGVKVDDSLDGIAQQACDGPGLVVVEATGLQIRVALELALARYPNLSDDFPHVSDDVRVIFRPDERPGRRIGKEGLFFEGKGMLKTRTYRVCTTARFARRAFLGSKAPHGAATVAVPAREGPLLVTLLRNLFADCTKSDGDSAPRAARPRARVSSKNPSSAVGACDEPTDTGRASSGTVVSCVCGAGASSSVVGDRSSS